MKTAPSLGLRLSACALSLSMLLNAVPARAQSDELSGASAMSIAIPVAMSVAAPSVFIAGVTTLTVVSVSAVADGTVWVLQKASDGARIVLKMSTAAVGGLSVAAGTVVTVTAISAGWVLSAAGQTLALIPNELGRALLHHERVIQ